MRLKHSWVLALFLTGCQLTSSETPNKTQPETNQKNTQVTTSSKPSKTQSTDTKTVKEIPEVTPQSQLDVWQRIAMQLEMPIPDHKKVDYYRTWYLKHPRHLQTVAKRAEPFLFLITEKIEKRGLPLELALLPVVESSFDPFAYSHGSAAGLWQFVPGTGKMFGLEQNYWYDGRRDVTASTDAALDYLESLNRRFDGNWNHAIAAYNSGGGRVSSAIRKNKKANKPIDFFSLSLPKETSGYVPKLLALADIVANQEKYGINIPAIANQPVLAQVNPKEQLDLAIAAKYAGLSVSELQSYNPAYNQWATAPDGPHHLLLPLEKVEQFNKRVMENRGNGMKLVRHQVKSGDTLSVLAKKYNTTTKVIQAANELKSTSIWVGQNLMIPTSTKDDSIYALSADNRLAKTQSRTRGKYKLNHTVASGDSLWSIAKKHKVSHKSLAKWNGMGPRDTLRIGQKLVIWKDSSDGAIIRPVFYKVRSGDTISGIASKFKVKTGDIVKWNDLNKSKYLQPGQKLKLYVDVTKVSA
ncbi:Putative Lytic Transglycosylase/Lysozyme domain fused with LysM repeat and MLTD_N domains [Vibrio nigripulchritudo SO65]|uniref:LysM peptidoglycan-binding domain-containing protein n=1 Tax=Vibrio nigripulchritudo TaxID=28173 RepID=UPI0003B196BD|nr:LysM peptidoglycan-binding domain-containing protein [Vibrio nigripulchritudo]CCN32853.1 Putative Lytic Transglycosylase/Lysozyme domain fused with LysM repeat and MLTD_N domains [Vibrio nigripulchritudo AM115]CCN40932.1 Putative Lytic Transglycosylase/Lysozyme domain fused with LysM repeat and MLTD_N domains [Vibrio nigripulchritudo FTn2]CCN66196.1 Putative Lytic Transglycosylase/Lysozyme domain fused with LysM repeat and MLTD_N domains [Vibrio nigripulchritudo POn4]CCN78387.1 Putative Lyti